MRTRANLFIEILVVLAIIGIIMCLVFPKSHVLEVASCFVAALLLFVCYFHEKAQKKPESPPKEVTQVEGKR